MAKSEARCRGPEHENTYICMYFMMDNKKRKTKKKQNKKKFQLSPQDCVVRPGEDSDSVWSAPHRQRQRRRKLWRRPMIGDRCHADHYPSLR